MSLEEKRNKFHEVMAAGVPTKLTEEQKDTLRKIWNSGADSVMPLIDLWMQQNYNVSFNYAWVACEYTTELQESQENNAE